MRVFRTLIDSGHSLLVVEHNLDVIRAADWVIDMGPEGGEAGGEVIATGAPQQFCEMHSSPTALALQHDHHLPDASTPIMPKPRLSSQQNVIHIHHARENNLKNIKAHFVHQNN